MRTALDDTPGKWFLEKAVYVFPTLSLVVAEGVTAEEDSSITVAGKTFGGLRAVNLTEGSRMIEVSFDHVLAHHIIDESFTAWDDYESRDSSDVLQVLGRSRFLDFLAAQHGWMFEIGEKATHYRVWTYD